VGLAKRDGKQRRPKQESEPVPASNSLSPSPPSSPRVDLNCGIPIRHQLRLVSQEKELDRKSSPAYRAPKAAKPYRKETKTAEEYRKDREEREALQAELSKQESKNFALRSLYQSAKHQAGGTNTHPPILLVDGYNVLFKWDRTKDLGSFPGELQEAREVLLEALGVYSHTNGVRVVVAFDAMRRFSSSSSIPSGQHHRTTDSELLSTGVTCVYCVDQEADSFIEGQVDEWLAKGALQVVVATSDIAHKAVVDSKVTSGRQVCFVVPSSGLIKDMESTELKLREALDEMQKSPALNLLGSVVKSRDKDAFKTMQTLRLTLPPAPGTWEARKAEMKGNKKSLTDRIEKNGDDNH